VNPAYSRYLPQIFGGPVLSELARGGRSDAFSYILTQSGYRPNRPRRLWDVYEDVYDFLLGNYRCEYVYKNAIAHRLVFERHSIETATLLTEFRVDARKADVVVLNGTSSVYEIKTHLDNLDRLPGQIAAYRRVFDRICVATDELQADKVAAAVEEDIGVVVLTSDLDLEERRPPQANVRNVDPECIFRSLRQAEYKKIIHGVLGAPTDFPSGVVWQECQKLFMEIPPTIAHEKMVEALHARGRVPGLRSFLDSLPRSLQHAGLTTKLTRREKSALGAVMLQPVRI
jgi:hypothetical protein